MEQVSSENLQPPTSPSPDFDAIIKKHHKPQSKKWLLGFFIVGIVLGVIGYFRYQDYQKAQSQIQEIINYALYTSPTPAPDPTVNWKTYTNQQCLCTFKYPSDSRIFPEIRINREVSRFEKYYQATNNADVDGFIKIKNLLIDNYNAVQYGDEWAGHEQATPYYEIGTLINKDGTIIEIKVISQNKNEYNLFKPTYDQILSTFKFLDSSEAVTKNGCVVGGCSSELCVEESEGEIASICIYKDEYACYKNAKCERQAGGKCGWTETQELQACLAEF